MKLKDNYGNVYDVSIDHNLKLELLLKKEGEKIILFYNSRIYVIEKVLETTAFEEHSKEEIISPITGKINKLNVKEGDFVNKDDVLLTIESMKMEMIITSPQNAMVEKVHCKEGEVVGQGKLLLKLKFLV
ncbi:MAG: acetyl-CoA carboxylase biotin carboxyl carrier protein subunit [candidate division WOR-3 bacterium]|jgi:biotin carboxyl carrier protein